MDSGSHAEAEVLNKLLATSAFYFLLLHAY